MLPTFCNFAYDNNYLQLKKKVPEKKFTKYFWSRKVELIYHSVNIYLFKVNNRNSRKRGEICSKLTTKTPERRQ